MATPGPRYVPSVIEHAILNLFATVAAMDATVFGSMWLLERWLYKRRLARSG